MKEKMLYAFPDSKCNFFWFVSIDPQSFNSGFFFFFPSKKQSNLHANYIMLPNDTCGDSPLPGFHRLLMSV